MKRSPEAPDKNRLWESMSRCAAVSLIVCLPWLTGCAVTPKPVPATAEVIDLKPFVIPDDGSARTIPIKDLEAIDPANPNYLRVNLERYGLAPLTEAPAGKSVERIRFLWLRSFHPAALFEVDFDASGHGEYRASIWKQDHGWDTLTKYELDRRDREFYRECVGNWHLFEVPRNDHLMGLDGAEWIFELTCDKRHHEFVRWTPDSGPIREFGQTLIESAIKSPFLPIY